MDENQKGVEENVQPSAEQPAAEVEGSENEAPQEPKQQDQTQDTQEKPVDVSGDEFPEEPEKQKQAFYAMRKKIEELEGRAEEQDEDIDFLNIARGVTETQIPSGYVAQTQQGTFDESDPATQAFLQEVQQARYEAQAARREALAAKAQQEDLEAWSKYPALNPKSTNRDKGFIADVQAQYVLERNRAIATGKNLPRLVDVADKVQKRYDEIRTQAKEQGATEERATQAQKEAATIESRGTTVGTMNVEPDRVEELRARARRGDEDALTELNKLTDPFISNWEE